jgi:pseudaminic acid synthase
LPLIKKVARTKKPVFISTGLANKKDIQEALKVLKENNCRRIILMKCTSSYPAPLEEINLKTMQQYEKTFNVKVGYSDHTLNNSASMAATALGARVIEKHIVLNDKIKSLDSFFSMNLNNFKIFVKNIREVGKCIVYIRYKISKSSKKNLNGRKSLYVSEDIKKGDIFSIKNIKSVRPSYGLHPKYLYRFVGKKSKKNLKKGERLKISLLR